MESNLFIIDWLTQSWGLKGPITCHLQAQESQRCSSSPNLKAWEAGKPRPEWEGPRNRHANIQRQKETGVSTKDREQARPSSASLFYSCPQWTARHSAALVHMLFSQNLPIQMLITSRNTLTDTPRNNELAFDLWASHSSNCHTKINHYTCQRPKLNLLAKPQIQSH